MSAEMTIDNDNHYDSQHAWRDQASVAQLHALVNQMREDQAITSFPVSFPSVDAYVPMYASRNVANKYWRLCDIKRR